MIERYVFGKMTISGVEYRSDLLILPDKRIVHSWRRQEGHALTIDDLETVLETRPSVIIAGTGRFGFLRPHRDLAARLEKCGVCLDVAPTMKAVARFNARCALPGVAACFHLTC